MRVLGVDLGGTHIRAGIIDGKGNILEQEKIRTMSADGAALSRLIELIDKMIKPEILAIGIGVPGPIDLEAGMILNPPNLPDLHNVKIKEILEDRYHLPVGLERDANAALIGEHWIGEAKGLKNVAMIIWGTGVGGAIICDNHIYRGHSKLAGEIGHMIVDEDGPDCAMGHRGCLESLIGGAAIKSRVGVSLEEIAEQAREGNKDSREIFAYIGDYLKAAIKNIIMLFDPELILLDGSGVKSFDLVYEKIKYLPIKVSQNAQTAGLLGAGRVGLDMIGAKR